MSIRYNFTNVVSTQNTRSTPITPKRGDIYFINPNPHRPTVGSMEWTGRPAVIVSSNETNARNNTYEVVYMTTTPRENVPEHCTIKSSKMPSTMLCEQITTIDRSQLGKRLGRVTDEEMESIEDCLLISLGIELTCDEEYDEEEEREAPDLNGELQRANEMIADQQADMEALQTKYDKLKAFCCRAGGLSDPSLFSFDKTAKMR